MGLLRKREIQEYPWGAVSTALDTSIERRDHWRDRARAVEELLAELWADESVRAAVGQGGPGNLYERIETALGETA